MLLLLNNRKKKTDHLSYVQKIKDALEIMKIPYYETNKVEVLPSHIKTKIRGIIISGSSMILSSPNLPYEKYAFNIHYLREFPDVPVYGICFGCQILAIIYGYELKHGKMFCEKTNVLSRHKLFSGLPENHPFQFCFTDLILPQKKSSEISWFTFRDGNKYPCAFEFEKGKIFGSLFHPEFFEDTYKVLHNFAKITKSV